ncbi:MAG: methyl-accepting chemotaxis protein, partial [Paracoccaceae bacterium]
MDNIPEENTVEAEAQVLESEASTKSSRINNVRTKLVALFAFVVILTGAAIGTKGYLDASEGMHALADKEMQALAEARKSSIKDYFGTIEQDLRFISSNPNTLSALHQFTVGWQTTSGDRTAQLQKAYITDNPHPTGKKEEL